MINKDQAFLLLSGMLKELSKKTALQVLGMACMLLGELEIASQLFAKSNGSTPSDKDGQP